MIEEDMDLERDYPDSEGIILQKGDLIEFRRTVYSHWAIYAGDGYVIHLTGTKTGESATASGSSVTGNQSIVEREMLSNVIQGSEFIKNNLYDKNEEYSPFPPEKIIRRAESCIGKKYNYNLLKTNCEHFVCKMRYDRKVSAQVDNATKAILIIECVAVVIIALSVLKQNKTL